MKNISTFENLVDKNVLNLFWFIFSNLYAVTICQQFFVGCSIVCNVCPS